MIACATVRTMARIDPALARALDSAAASNDVIEVVCSLKPLAPDDVTTSPADTERLARELIDRVAAAASEQPQRWNVFRNMGSFVIAAPAGFVRELLKQPEIHSAVANRQPF